MPQTSPEGLFIRTVFSELKTKPGAHPAPLPGRGPPALSPQGLPLLRHWPHRASALHKNENKTVVRAAGSGEASLFPSAWTAPPHPAGPWAMGVLSPSPRLGGSHVSHPRGPGGTLGPQARLHGGTAVGRSDSAESLSYVLTRALRGLSWHLSTFNKIICRPCQKKKKSAENSGKRLPLPQRSRKHADDRGVRAPSPQLRIAHDAPARRIGPLTRLRSGNRTAGSDAGRGQHEHCAPVLRTRPRTTPGRGSLPASDQCSSLPPPHPPGDPPVCGALLCPLPSVCLHSAAGRATEVKA